MQIIARNQTLRLHEHDPSTSDLGKTRAWNIAAVIRVLIRTEYLFDNQIPDVCVVSNPEMGFEDQCRFSSSMLQSVYVTSGNKSAAFFQCCTNSADDDPGIWVYGKDTKLTSINTTGRSFELMKDTSTGSDDNDHDANGVHCAHLWRRKGKTYWMYLVSSGYYCCV